jgi:ribosomal protein L21E
MNRKKHGLRRRSRDKLTQARNKKGKVNLKSRLQSFEMGDMVQLLPDPQVQKGMFHLRFYGKKGTIAARQGSAYKVTIMDHNKQKSFFVNPAHLKKMSEA